EWDTIQLDVEQIDQFLQVNLGEMWPLQTERGEIGFALPLSSWAYLYKLRQIEWIVQLGFELSVYQPDELAGMYWYLNYLAKTRAQHGDRIKSFTQRARESQHKTDTPGREHEHSRSQAYIRITMLDAACTWEFADGLCCLYTVLQRLGLVKSPPRPYSTDALRYDMRMKPFAYIALPPLPTFDELTRATAQPETSIADLMRYAENAVGGARKGYEALSKFSDAQAFAVGSHAVWVANVKGCLKAAIAADVAISTVQKAWAQMEAEETPGGEGDGDPEEKGKGKGKEKEVVGGGSEGGSKGKAKENAGAGGMDQGNIKLKLEMPEPGKGYHDWWVVPKLIAIA
ncbi:Uu.00g134870.m01.CDS01, partial [Anthostomella pinea]